MEKHDCECLHGIVCDATNCTYNESKKCTAPGINVGGSTAHNAYETECDTFKAR